MIIVVDKGEEFFHILFINFNIYHDHLYLIVDGRGFELCIILDDQSMFYTVLQKVIRFFFLFTLQSLFLSKQLIRDSFRDLLHEAKERGCALLEERWLSEECMQAVMAFIQRKSKLQPRFHFLAAFNLSLYRTKTRSAAEVKVLLFLSITQSSGLIRGGFCLEEGKGGMSRKQKDCERD